MVQRLGNILWIWIFSYMDIRTDFLLLCNSMQEKKASSSDPPSHLNTQYIMTAEIIKQWSYFNWSEIVTSPKKQTILYNGKMCLVTDNTLTHTHTHTHNSPRLVQTLYKEKLYLKGCPLFYAYSRELFYSCENHFYYIYVLLSIYINNVICAIRW